MSIISPVLNARDHHLWISKGSILNESLLLIIIILLDKKSFMSSLRLRHDSKNCCLSLSLNPSLTISYNTIKYNTLQYNNVRCNAINPIEYNTIPHNAKIAAEYDVMQHTETHCSTVQHSARQ